MDARESRRYLEGVDSASLDQVNTFRFCGEVDILPDAEYLKAVSSRIRSACLHCGPLMPGDLVPHSALPRELGNQFEGTCRTVYLC